MKYDYGDIIEHFECSCHSLEHVIRFHIIDDQKYGPDLYMHVYLDRDRGFFRRLFEALKYAFNIGKPCRYGQFDEFILNYQDADRMIDMLNEYKNMSHTYTQRLKEQQRAALSESEPCPRI